MNRKGDFIETYTGRKFYPLDPRPEEVSLKDIAHALSNICRFNGHTKYFYSVAQHSLNVYWYLRSDFNQQHNVLLYGILHDASEAYIADVSRPLKKDLGTYTAVEKTIQEIIWKAFEIPPPSPIEWSIVKQVDTIILQMESLHLMPCIQWRVDPLRCPAYIDLSLTTPNTVENEFLAIIQGGEAHVR